ncbi:hypothetical protein [Candidatus Avelusimicrobium stercoris]|uniref:hypothetical protein n=1 Tax=Candidatus Avelusimicrobium stercoris TaxID=1947924 RepID=UPI003D0CDAAE
MRIKIKNPSTYISLQEILVVVMFMALGSCFFFMLGGEVSWQSYNALVAEMSKGDVVALLVFKALPFLVLFFVVGILYRLVKRFSPSGKSTPSIRVVEFLPEGVKLEYNKGVLPVFLPYKETHFFLTITAFDMPTKNGHRPVVGSCKISFTQENKNFACERFSARPLVFIPQLLDERHRFASFTFFVNPKSSYSPRDEEAANKIRTLFQDYIDYGILCPYNKEARYTFLGLGIFFCLFITLPIVLFAPLDGFLIIPALITMVFPVAGIWMICKAVKAIKQAKELERRKEAAQVK